jgi:hypothetical protein
MIIGYVKLGIAYNGLQVKPWQLNQPKIASPQELIDE